MFLFVWNHVVIYDGSVLSYVLSTFPFDQNETAVPGFHFHNIIVAFQKIFFNVKHHCILISWNKSGRAESNTLSKFPPEKWKIRKKYLADIQFTQKTKTKIMKYREDNDSVLLYYEKRI